MFHFLLLLLYLLVRILCIDIRSSLSVSVEVVLCLCLLAWSLNSVFLLLLLFGVCPSFSHLHPSVLTSPFLPQTDDAIKHRNELGARPKSFRFQYLQSSLYCIWWFFFFLVCNHENYSAISPVLKTAIFWIPDWTTIPDCATVYNLTTQMEWCLTKGSHVWNRAKKKELTTKVSEEPT